jgi:hypothetical protein
MNNASEINPEENNRSTESDNSSVTEQKSSCLVISEVSAQTGGDPEITPLSSISGLPVEPFDFDLLPKSLKAWAEDMQYRLQCPADYIGVGIMIGLASAVGNKVTVQPKSNDHSWKVVPNLWGLLIGSPSSMKSPAMDAALQHINKMEEELRKHPTPQNPFESLRLMVRDTTIEKLQMIQGYNPTGLLYVQDEISALFRKFEQPNSSDRQYLLEAFNGNSSYSVDRVSRGSVFIEKNTLSLIGTIQPDVLQSIFLSQSSSNDGFMQRLQLAVWPDSVDQEYVDSQPDAKAERTAWIVFTELYDLHKGNLKFSDKAQEVFIDWYKQTINSISDLTKDKQLDLASHITKYRKLIPALALLIELAENAKAESISEESLTRSILWANYLITHAKRIYNIKDKASVVAQRILDKKDRLDKAFSPSEITQSNWSGLKSTEDIRLGIELLIKHKYLIQMESQVNKKGGRPSEKYRWNNTLPT